MALTLFRRALLNGDAEAAAARQALRAATTGEELDAALGTAPPDTARIAHLIASGEEQIARRDALRAQCEW